MVLSELTCFLADVFITPQLPAGNIIRCRMYTDCNGGCVTGTVRKLQMQASVIKLFFTTVVTLNGRWTRQSVNEDYRHLIWYNQIIIFCIAWYNLLHSMKSKMGWAACSSPVDVSLVWMKHMNNTEGGKARIPTAAFCCTHVHIQIWHSICLSLPFSRLNRYSFWMSAGGAVA